MINNYSLIINNMLMYGLVLQKKISFLTFIMIQVVMIQTMLRRLA